MNSCIFTGRTTDEAELRYTQDGLAFAGVSLAVDDGFGDKKKTYFFEFVAFGKTAENLAKMVPKGTKIAVNGRAQQNRWKDKEGKNKSKVVFVINAWEFAQSKGDGQTATTATKAGAGADDDFMDLTPEEMEFLPFS